MAYFGAQEDMYNNPYGMSHIAMDEAPDTAMIKTAEELFLVGQEAWQYDPIQSTYDYDFEAKQDPILTTLHNLAGQGEWEQEVIQPNAAGRQQVSQHHQWNTWAPTMPVALPPSPPATSDADSEEASVVSRNIVQPSSSSTASILTAPTVPSVQQQQQQQMQQVGAPTAHAPSVIPYIKQESSLYDEEEDEGEDDYFSKRDRDEYRDRMSVPINVNSFYDLTDEQLATIDFKELTRLMTEAGLSNEDILETKARRRRLKNRLSARVCSNKKREKCSELTETNRSLINRITDLEKENSRLRQENSSLKEMNVHITKASTESTHEVNDLRTQVQQLTQMLVQAGLLSTVDAAAFAA